MRQVRWGDKGVLASVATVAVALAQGAAIFVAYGAPFSGAPAESRTPEQSGAGDLPAPAAIREVDIFLAPPVRTIRETIGRGATLASLLDAHDVGREAVPLIDAVRAVFDPRRFRVGNPYRLRFDREQNFVRRFEYHVDDESFLRVTRAASAVDGADAAAFTAALIPYKAERKEATVRGTIDATNNSLVAAIDAGGETVTLAIALAEIFSGEIDFNNDLRRGDHFALLFERTWRAGVFGEGDTVLAGYGDILAAEFVNEGRELHAYRFRVPDEPEAQYFDSEGRSMKRLFLRSPFRFEPRVTSRFSYRRLHPVHGNVRPHLGVDYGAPVGTPVVAVATGSVVSAGRSGASGNMVRLRHTNGYETYYLHLSAFAAGMQPGVRVGQGQIIGRVGATGVVTGPHLDYRMRKNGVFVNPLLEHRNLPPGDPVPETQMAAFEATRDATWQSLRTGVESGYGGGQAAP